MTTTAELTTTGLPTVAGSTLLQVGPDAWAWSCDDPTQTWDNDLPLLLTYPGHPTWYDPGACKESNKDTTPCPAPEPLAHATIVQEIRRAGGLAYGAYYQCEDGWGMASGASGTLAQCDAGGWTPVTDVCVQECCVPQDCSGIAALGLTNEGGHNYLVSPAGQHYNEAIHVGIVPMRLTTLEHGHKGQTSRPGLSLTRPTYRRAQGCN
ncbi:uncharacterized protein [Panulirus ornatus]|uniref:uncharacterized protein n=1 Tax=Panulirus ornatus TaxID=150431 RepID=UPI003A898D88